MPEHLIQLGMVRQAIRDHLAGLLDRPSLELSDDWGAEDVDGWDSLVHLKLLSILEEEFDIVFGVNEIEAPTNAGELAALVKHLTDARS